MQPALAEKWEAPDDKTWIFHLRPGLKFHNGDEVTADDVIYSMTLQKKPPEPGVSNSFSFTNGLTLAAWIRPQWVGTSNTYDAIFSKDDGANRITFAFQYDSSNSVGLVSVPPGPVLAFGLNIDGAYSELDMPLDGASGRPTLPRCCGPWTSSTRSAPTGCARSC